METKQVPFNQFTAPQPGKMPGKWFRRHIIIDHVTKVIYLQIFYDGSGELKYEEFFNITKGEWWKYVPDTMRAGYREAIASGYKIKAVAVTGQDFEEQHTIMQIIDITNERNIFKDDSLKAKPE